MIYSYGFSSCLLDTFLNIIDALVARSWCSKETGSGGPCGLEREACSGIHQHLQIRLQPFASFAPFTLYSDERSQRQMCKQ